MGRKKTQPATCAGPDCSLPAYARGLCRAHYAYEHRHPGAPLYPLRSRDAPVLERISLRVTGHCAAAVREDLTGARSALEQWASKRA